jgi:hypothetical protein
MIKAIRKVGNIISEKLDLQGFKLKVVEYLLKKLGVPYQFHGRISLFRNYFSPVKEYPRIVTIGKENGEVVKGIAAKVGILGEFSGSGDGTVNVFQYIIVKDIVTQKEKLHFVSYKDSIDIIRPEDVFKKVREKNINEAGD